MNATYIRISPTFHNSINDIKPDDWDACAKNDNPFISHAFLSVLEDSQSACPASGWLPLHATYKDEKEQVGAVIPTYIKSHSFGEYVFDQSWAESWERAGGRYYPKLQIAVPFSPVPGARLLTRPDSKISPDALGNTLIQTTQKLGASSAHITFCTEQEWTALGQAGWLQRIGIQFHWHNNAYKTFEDFLNALSSSHRKKIRRERREANAAGLNFRILRGADIKAKHWDAFYKFYQITIDKKWGSAYLTRPFFELLSERLADKVILMLAEYENAPVAGALNLIGQDTLYGRNWGCIGEWPFLHFELCYYRAVDFAIEHGLRKVEAGAQGEHKIQRGYTPQRTYSAHWIANRSFSNSVKEFLSRETQAVQASLETFQAMSPFRETS